MTHAHRTFMALCSPGFGAGLLRLLSRGMRLLMLLVALTAALPAMASSAEPVVERVELEVRSRKRALGHQTLRIRGRYHVKNWNSGQGLTLLNFSEFLSEPTKLDRRESMPHLQGPYVSGKIEVHSLFVGGKEHPYSRQGERRDIKIAPFSRLPTSSKSKDQVLLEIEYTLKVPRRGWPFGCVRGKCALSGAIAPLPAKALEGDNQFVVSPARWKVKWPKCASRPGALFIEDSQQSSAAKLYYPQVAWAPRSAGIYQTSQFYHRGVSIRIWGARGQGTANPPAATFWDWEKNVRRSLAQSAREAIDTALHFGLDLGWGDRLSILVGPYFADISVPDGHNILVSSNYLDVLPLKRFASFHRGQLMRSILDALAMKHFGKRGARPDDLWLAGALGNELARRAAKIKEQKKGDIADAVHGLRFMPMVDQMLYGGQTSNASAFFDSVEDPLPLRNHPLYFSHEMPRGGRIAFKLRDALGLKKFGTWIDTLIKKPNTSARQLADTLAPSGLADGFFEQWLGPYPEVDYAILDVQHRQENGHWICEVQLARKSETEIHETVDLRFTFPDKSHKTVVWKPKGQGLVRGSVKLKSAVKVKQVQIDPDGKLAQVAKFPGRSWEKKAHVDPLFNDKKPPGSRFLYTGIDFHLAVAEMFAAKTKAARLRSFDGNLTFAAGLRRDLRREFSFLIAKDRDTLLNLGGGLAWFFGRKVTPNRRRLKLSVDSEIDFLNPSGLDHARGIRTTQTLSLADDTQTFLFEPHRGHRFKLMLKRSDVWTPNPTGKRSHQGFWRAGIDLSQRFRLAHGHILALQAVAEMVFVKNTPEFRGLARAGGPGRLSAFGADEIFGRALAVGLAEYRHTLFDHVRLNALGLAWVRNVGGALSGGVGTVSACESFSGFGAKENWYGQVGYGITALYDFLGMAPEMIRLDLSVPLGRNHRTCLGRKFPDALAEVQGLPASKVKSLLPKVSFNILIEQPF